MVQTAESSMNNIQSMLQRVRELAVQYQNGSLQQNDKDAIQGEVDQLTDEIDRQRGAVSFNGSNLLDGTANNSAAVTYQVGANASDTLTASFADIRGSLSAANGFCFSNVNSATSHVFDLSALAANALSDLDSAIKAVSTQASILGAVQNRLQYTADAISATETNLSASNSRIKDVDMASEMTTMTQEQILQQAGTSMLAQANAAPQMVLKLLGG
jgi:flagellin